DSAAAEIFREIGRASRKGSTETLEAERTRTFADTPVTPVAPPAVEAHSIANVQGAVKSLIDSAAAEPAAYPHLIFEDADRDYELPLNEGFTSGYSYRLTVGIGMHPDQRFGGPSGQPAVERGDSGETIQLRVAIFHRAGAISVEGDQLSTLDWP